jgi:hypothetical protein
MIEMNKGPGQMAGMKIQGSSCFFVFKIHKTRLSMTEDTFSLLKKYGNDNVERIQAE